MNRIKELRKFHKLTLEQLGNQLGVANNTISQWESGKREPSLELIIKISRLFGVSTDYLLGNSDEQIVSIDKIKALVEQIKDLEAKLDDLEEKQENFQLAYSQIDKVNILDITSIREQIGIMLLRLKEELEITISNQKHLNK